jgi:hypothetical protein
VYQLLFKHNRPNIPFGACKHRLRFFCLFVCIPILSSVGRLGVSSKDWTFRAAGIPFRPNSRKATITSGMDRPHIIKRCPFRSKCGVIGSTPPERNTLYDK